MSLSDYQCAVTQLCFGEAPTGQHVHWATPEDQPHWLLYRRMTQDRLVTMLTKALPRCLKTLGGPRFRTHAEQWIESTPPTTRFIRDIVPSFIDHCIAHWSHGSEDAPSWVVDLARYELALWVARDLDPPPRSQPADFVFEAPPALDPTARVLALDHPVHRVAERYDPQPTHLLVYRREDHKVMRWAVEPLWANMVRMWIEHPSLNVTEALHQAAKETGHTVDATIVEPLSTFITEAIRNGVILGSRVEG